ncbi:lysylphosphatidylglycerol synthase domain-containing protein [Actinomadura sp. NPDC047616]|uniref:lysylphosphatidylglycerol synthase domain-containing protein n=1 Tax=Actinomadura sp. NPDC047616 TaxID=3155914 RepID=UPI0033DAFA1A
MNRRALRSVARHAAVRWTLAIVVVTGVAAAFVTAVRDQRQEIVAAAARLSPAAVLLAWLLVLAGSVAAMAAWRAVFAADGGPRGWRAAAGIFFVGQLGTYIPGGGWQPMLQLYMGRRAGVPASRIVTAFALNVVVSVSAGLTLGLAAAPAVLGTRAWWLAAPALVALVGIARPQLLAGLVRRAVRRWRSGQAAAPSAGRIRRAYAGSLLSWGLHGAHLWVLAVALGAPALRALPLCLGGMALSILAGSFLPLTPGGVGIREVVLTVALVGVLPQPAIVIVIAVSRLGYMAADAVLAGLPFLGRARPARLLYPDSART